jgi:hypothetical protein
MRRHRILACFVLAAGLLARPALSLAEGAGEVVVFDARRASFADALTLTCLQGVVNREAPQLYLVLHEADLPWPDLYAKAFGLAAVRVEKREDLLQRCKPRLKGCVGKGTGPLAKGTCPPTPDTANLAATLAGLEDCLVVAPDGVAEAEKLGLPRRHDFRGQFAGKPRAAVYAWAADQLWPRCSRDLVGALSVASPPPVVLDVSRLLAEGGNLCVQLEDAVKEDDRGARLHHVRLEWGPPAGPAHPAHRTIAFRPGTDGELPYLLDPGRSWMDHRGGRAADRDQVCLYRLRGTGPLVKGTCPRPSPAKLTLDLSGQYLVRATGRAGGPYETLARSTRPIERPSHAVRDLLVARRALAFDLADGPEPADEAALRRRFLEGKPRVLAGGPANLTVHNPIAAIALPGIPPGGLAAPCATYAAADLMHTTGARMADPEATCPEVHVGRPGQDQASGHLVYGPYEHVPPGRYAVAWRLKAVGPLADAPLATLDVFDVQDASKLYAARTLKGADLAPAGRTQWIILPIELPKTATLEYRVQWHGGAELRADRIVVWALSL